MTIQVSYPKIEKSWRLGGGEGGLDRGVRVENTGKLSEDLRRKGRGD